MPNRREFLKSALVVAASTAMVKFIPLEIVDMRPIKIWLQNGGTMLSAWVNVPVELIDEYQPFNIFRFICRDREAMGVVSKLMQRTGGGSFMVLRQKPVRELGGFCWAEIGTGYSKLDRYFGGSSVRSCQR